ncbi:MAG: class I SAM-dependent methyltransferase [Planctomycetota bacterium]
MPSPDELRDAFAHFQVDPASVRELGSGGPMSARCDCAGGEEFLVGRRFEALDRELGESDPFFLFVEGTPDDRRLAMWRNSLWPLVHVGAVLRIVDGKAEQITLHGREAVEGTFDFDGAILFGRRRTHVMSPDATVEKFDRNAAGWDGVPGGAGYPHFRWMRRHVGLFAKKAARSDRRLRVLDFGCGAGWVGIEAARALGDVELAAFDPSLNMVEIAAANAKKEGIASFDGRVGFGEDPPFVGDEPFDVVLSSGVVSFSPDVESWLDGLTEMIAPGGHLVVGDIHPHSRGFLSRRRRKPLLPVREMNARTREEIRAGLERRGFEHVRSGAYQLSRPIPELMHVNETKLFGTLTYPLLWANRLATKLDESFGSPMQDNFDSWVMHLRAPDPETEQ